MKNKALVSGHIYLNDGLKDIEILTQIDDDDGYSGIFDDIDQALLENIDTGKSDDYYFTAYVEAEFVKYQTWEGAEWETDYTVKEIKSITDISLSVEVET